MQSRLLKNILSVSGVLILVKALGFFKQMVIAGIFGANAETDLINLSYGFIGDIQYLLVQVMLTAVVSVYIHVKEETQNEAGQFASDTLCAGTIVVAAISATIFMLSPWISKLLAPSYSQELSIQLRGLYSPIFPDPHSIGLDGGFSCTSQLQQTLYPRSTGGIVPKRDPGYRDYFGSALSGRGLPSHWILVVCNLQRRVSGLSGADLFEEEQ